jgi:LysM repeat protein
MKPDIHFIFLAAVLLLTACGSVITPQPAADDPSADTPTPNLSPSLRTTATPPVLPPADTATPTVSPTPITYVVQSGDTLLGIALDYGVDVDRLMAVNGIDNPLLLRVGQELIIPTGEEETGEPSSLLLSTPTPLPFGVRGVAFHETPVGSLWCLGEVVNTTASTLTNVQVRVLLFDADGELGAAADVFADADLIPPGERSPFRVLFTDPPASWASPQVTIIRGEEAGGLAAAYVPIAVLQPEERLSGPQFQVSGVLQNDSAERAAASISVIVTIYDEEGLVTGTRQEEIELETPLAPTATMPFTMLLNFHGDAPADFHVVALGHIPSD